MKNCLVVFCLAAVSAFAGTITQTTDDMTALGDWTVDVAAGDSNVVTVAQSGSGKIIKTGGGYLVLRKNSTFTGGVELQAGFLMVDPDADAGTSGTVNCTALGTGDVTILGQRSGYTGYCELGIVGAGSNDTRIVTIANNINVTGTSDGTYPALVFYGQNSVLTGKITAAEDFYFWENEPASKAIWSGEYNRYVNVLACTFGEIEVAGTIGYAGFCRYVFGGKVKTPKLDLTIRRTMRSGERNANDYNNAHGGFVFTTPCEIDEIVDGHRYLWCNAANLLPGTLLRHTSYNGGHTLNFLNMYAYSPETDYDQTLGGLVSEPLYDGQKMGSDFPAWGVRGKGSKTLTLTGIAPDAGETEKELVTSASFGQEDSTSYVIFNLTIDAYDGFTQTVSNRTHNISRTIRVKKGAFRAAGSAKFPRLTGITVDAGAAFWHATTNAAAFPALKTLDIAGNFIVGPNAAADFMAMSGYTEIRLSSSATFTVPSGTAFYTASFYVDGVKQPIGTWSHAQFPVIPEGVTITSSTGASATDTAEWTGAAEADNLMSTMANWKDNPASLDLSHYTLGATVKGNGEEMVYTDGTKIHNIMFKRTPASTPFTIRPATPGASLEIAGRIEVTNAAQLVIKDATIATPSHIDQGAASQNGGMVMYISLISNADVASCAESNNVYRSGTYLPVVLDNATIEKPVFSTGNGSGITLLYCMPGTTNEFKGQLWHYSAWPYFAVPEDAQLTFSGGLRGSILIRKRGAGTIIVKEKPITSSSYFGIYQGKLVLDVEDCSLRGSTSGEGMILERSEGASELEFRRSYCFNGDSALIIPYNNTNTGLVEFAATTQRVTRLFGNVTSANVKMHGDPGSLFEVVGGRTDMQWAAYKLLTNRVDLTGALSFRLSATNETMTFYAKDFSTCGDLEVSAGTLNFKSDASWLHGTNVAVNGEGRLKVAKGGTFGAKFAELSLADEGVFEIPSGQSQTFLYVTTNGVVIPSGRYTSLPNGEGDFLAGGGEIVIRRQGVVISLH